MLGHEIQHGAQASSADEAVVNFETGMVMTEVLAKHSELAYLNSELARRMNDYAMAFLNSKHPHSAENVIIAPDGLGLFPGSTGDTNKDIWSEFHGAGASMFPTVATTVLASLGITGTDGNYDQSTAALFEHLDDP